MSFSASFQFPLLQPVVLFSPLCVPSVCLQSFLFLLVLLETFSVSMHSWPLSPGLAGGFLSSECVDTPQSSVLLLLELWPQPGADAIWEFL